MEAAPRFLQGVFPKLEVLLAAPADVSGSLLIDIGLLEI
jgi:hypothetical protein